MISDQIVDRFVRNLDQTRDAATTYEIELSVLGVPIIKKETIISGLIEHGWNVQYESAYIQKLHFYRDSGTIHKENDEQPYIKIRLEGAKLEGHNFRISKEILYDGDLPDKPNDTREYRQTQLIKTVGEHDYSIFIRDFADRLDIELEVELEPSSAVSSLVKSALLEMNNLIDQLFNVIDSSSSTVQDEQYIKNVRERLTKRRLRPKYYKKWSDI